MENHISRGHIATLPYASTPLTQAAAGLGETRGVVKEGWGGGTAKGSARDAHSGSPCV